MNRMCVSGLIFLILHFGLFVQFSIVSGQSVGFDSIPSETRELPLYFDLRNTGRLGEVKNQSTGGCWASATMSSVESFWRTAGFSDEKLSHLNLKNFHGFVSERSTNGNHYMATAYFSRRSGPVGAGSDADTVFQKEPHTLAYINEARYLPNNPELIKKTIMDFGAVYSMMYHNKKYLDTISNVYYTSREKINHAVTLVGWNDTKQTKNGSGVWIAQNSLGPKYGEEGFFYIPYSDPNILQYNAIWPNWMPYDPESRIYYYDSLGSYHSYGFGDSICYGLSKFIAQENGRIKSVGTFVNHADTKIEATIYKNFNPNTKEVQNKVGKTRKLNCKFPGYYTVDLDEPIVIGSNENFYVMMKYNSPSDTIPLPVENAIEGYSAPHLTTGHCWVNPDFEKWPTTWYECGSDTKYESLRFDLCIKVYFLTAEN